MEGEPRRATALTLKRFVATILLDGDPAAAYITVKESVEHEHRIYSLELTEIKKTVRLVARRISAPLPTDSL